MARLFVAVWPPDEVVAELATLARPETSGVRWTPPHQWHVTLRFLGEADPAEVARHLAATTFAATTAVLGPRVTTLGRGHVVIPVAGVDELAATCGESDRPFRGHLTLARVRRGGTLPALVGEPFDAAFSVDEVRLVESTLSPHGACYDVVDRWATRRGRD